MVGSAASYCSCRPDSEASAVAEHELKPQSYSNIVAWGYSESVFNPDYDIVSSTTRARRARFLDMIDPEEMFLRMFARFRRDRIIS